MKLFSLTFCLFLFSFAAHGQIISDIEMPDQLNIQEHTFTLNGAGTRSKFFINIYAAGLYLESRSADAQSILEQDKPMALRLHILSGLLSSDKMENATREGFEKSTNGNMAALAPQIETLINAFKEDINENDVFEFIYLPTIGTHVIKNGVLSTTIEGDKFKQAFFGIWLGDKPTQKKLKKALLNQ